jgi:hypothetical protein
MARKITIRGRVTTGAAVAALGLAPFAASPAAVAGSWGKPPPPKVKAPKSGSQYSGNHGLVLYISGKMIQLAAFDFKCGTTTGRTSLNDIKLKKTDKGYKFGIDAHGSISFRDERPDENGAVHLNGRFSRNAKTAAGKFRVKSAHCSTGDVKWTASRASAR